jgi:hypothetical protein
LPSKRRLPPAVISALIAFGATSTALVNAQHRLGGPLVDGSVIRFNGCGNYFFVAYRNEYALAEWIGGDMVRESEVLQATDDTSSFEREGRMSFTNTASGKLVDVIIERALLNQTDLSQLIHRYCR